MCTAKNLLLTIIFQFDYVFTKLKCKHEVCCAFVPLDNLSVGHQCCSQGGQDSKCKDSLYRSQCCGWRRLLASASRVALWICSRRPEAYDVRLSVKYHAQVKHTYSFFSNAAKGWASPCVLSFKLGHSFKQYLQCQPCSGGPHSRGQLFVI